MAGARLFERVAMVTIANQHSTTMVEILALVKIVARHQRLEK